MSTNTNTNTSTAAGGVASIAWTDVVLNPPSTGNTGALPRYENNTVNGSRWLIDSNGKAKLIYQAATPLVPDLVPVLDFKTQAEVDALAAADPKPNDGASYIITDGAHKSDIATWDEATLAWAYYTPADLDVTTITAPTLSDNQGKWKYDVAGDMWYQVQQGIVLPEPITRPVGPLNMAWARASTKWFGQWSGGNGIAYIQNDRVTLWGNNASFTSGGAGAESSVVRKMSWNWMNGDVAAYAPNGFYVPKFVDVVHNANVMLALDSAGKVWAAGNQVLGTGITTTPAGSVATTTPPNNGLMPIPAMQAKANVFGTKLFMNNVYYNLTNVISAVLDNKGDLWVAGFNGHGALGQGNITATAQWVKYPVPNVVDVQIGTYQILALDASGNLFYSGWDGNGCIDGSVTNKTTPLLVATDVKQFDTVQNSGNGPVDIIVVKTDGTLWGRGTNTSGELGMGHTANVTALTQVPGVNNARAIYGSRTGLARRVCLLRTDGTISFAGFNSEGAFGYSPHTAATTVTQFVQPSGAFQGTVTDVMLGRVSTVLTADGSVWQAGITDSRGLGFANNAWANTNKWQKTPLPEGVLAIRGFLENASGAWAEGYVALTPTYGVLAWGRNYPAYTNSAGGSEQYFSPREVIETRSVNNDVALSNPFAGFADTVATLTSINSGSITNVLDGAVVTVTATLNVTGAAGKLDLAGATLTGTGTGPNVLVTSYAYIPGTTGDIKVSFKVTAQELLASGAASAAQAWTLAIGSKTINLNSTRVNDAVAFSLSTNAAAYATATDGDWLPVTEAEYIKLIGSVAGADLVGSTVAKMKAASTAIGFTNFYAQPTLGTDSEGTLPANHYLIAVSFKPTAAQPTTEIRFGNAVTPNTATYSAVGPLINGAPVGQVFYVRKKPALQPAAGVLGIKGGANLGYATSAAPTVGYSGPATGFVTATSQGQTTIQLQGVYTTTKPY